MKHAVCLLLLCSFLASGLEARELTRVPAAWVEEALEKAGTNRPALEQVLAHFTADPEKQVAARFLIANMVDKGYIVTSLKDAKGTQVPFDTLAYPDFKASIAALEALEKQHGELDWARDEKVYDLEVVQAAFLIHHIDQSFEAWRATPEKLRVGFGAFLNFVLPYRGSQEPIDDWIGPLRRRYAARARDLGGRLDLKELYQWLSKDASRRVRFDERYYLHPTDQSFTEMGRSGQGRCEDITNMQTFAARSLAIATAADYTPYWAHRDNNHAWNVLLDANGKGSHKNNAHAAKVYRKMFAIQRDSLPFRLPEGRKAPNRFMQSTTAMDVTAQYAKTTDITVDVDRGAAGAERFAYLCVFNAGEWHAIHWGEITDGRVTFDRMGRNIVYLPAVHDGERLRAISCPLIVHKDGRVERLPGSADGSSAVTAIAVSPKKVSPDTFKVTPVNFLKQGERYVLHEWNVSQGGWVQRSELVAAAKAPRIETLRSDGLYWLVLEDGKLRRLERVWTVGAEGFQRWW